MDHHPPSADTPGDDQMSHSESPKAQDICDQPSAQSHQRQSPGVAADAMDPTLLPPAIQRSPPTLIEKAAVVRSLKGKEKEWTAVAEKKRPLQLLDLPVDILKEIIEKVCFVLASRECRLI